MPRRTLRVRLTLIYGALFLVSGVALLGIANVGARKTTVVARVPTDGRVIPPPPFIQHGTDAHRLAVSSAIALVVVLVLSVGFGWLVSGRALRPLRTITTTARDISASNLHRRLNLHGPNDEIKELGNTLDDLFGRLESSFESQRHFVANASHELRTPLTVERTLLQVALADPQATADTLRATCEELLKLGDQQARLIDALLTLASSERGVEIWEPFDLATVTEEVVEARRADAGQRGIRVDTTLPATPAIGDPSLVESLVANLVDNSLHHNVAGGWVRVSTGAVAGRPTILVSNSGPVVPQDEVERLLQPFQRLGHERIRSDGHGLGLAIVQAIAAAHGGSLSARPRPEGGLDVEVAFGGPPGTAAPG